MLFGTAIISSPPQSYVTNHFNSYIQKSGQDPRLMVKNIGLLFAIIFQMPLSVFAGYVNAYLSSRLALVGKIGT